MGTFSEAVDVECAPGWRPVQILWRGEKYQVVAGRRRAFTRPTTLPEHVGAADYELWELEVTHPERSRSILSISHRTGGDHWRLLRLRHKPREKVIDV